MHVRWIMIFVLMAMGLVGCNTTPEPSVGFQTWVDWRSTHCRFLGPLDQGQFVCLNGRTYNGSAQLDAEMRSPTRLVPPLPGRTLADLSPARMPREFSQSWDANDTASSKLLLGDNDDPFDGPLQRLSRLPDSELVGWGLAWQAWRAAHCTVITPIQATTTFQCDDGASYRVQVRPFRYRGGGIGFEERKEPSRRWLDRHGGPAWQATPETIKEAFL